MNSPTTLAALDRVETLRADLDGMRPLDPDRLGAAMQRLRIEWTYHSNAIEGNSLTYGETRALLMHGVTADGKPLKDHLDIKGHREALDFLEQAVRGDEPLTLAAIRELHTLLLGEPYESWAETPDRQRVRRTITPGAFKAQPNHVLTETGETHYYAPPEDVPARMADLVDLLRTTPNVHPVVFASDVHHRFAAIHPFDDGNGRMARLLMNLVLMRAGYPPAVLRQQNRPAYYGALAAADGGDLAPLVRFVATELAATLELYLRALRGEPDPDEFNLRAALLEREITARKTGWNRSLTTLHELDNRVLVPLTQQVDAGIRRLASMVESVEREDVRSPPDVTTWSRTGADDLPISDDDWTHSRTTWILNGFGSSPKKNMLAAIYAEAREDVFVISAAPLEGDLARLRYGHPLVPHEVARLGDRLLVSIVEMMEAAHRRAQAKRDR